MIDGLSTYITNTGLEPGFHHVFDMDPTTTYTATASLQTSESVTEAHYLDFVADGDVVRG